MKNEVVARPYARALFDLTREQNKEEQVARELGDVLMIWDGDREFREFVRRPEVPVVAKREAVERIFGDLDRVTARLLAIVIDKHREDILSTIYEMYRSLWDDSRGIIHAQVIAASVLTEDQQRLLGDALGRTTGRTVEIAVKRDQSLMGGVVVRIGDRVLDGSLARRLAVLVDRLKSGDGGGSVVEH